MRRTTRGLIATVALVGASLTAVGGSSAPATAATVTGPAVTVNATGGLYPVSPGIYGMNAVTPAVAAALKLPLHRWGGNATERYDWRTGVTNTGNDYFFENIADCWSDAQEYCSKPGASSYRKWQEQLDADHAAGTTSVLTLPATGWVSKAPKYSHPFDCGYPMTSVSSAQSDPYDTNCGNGRNGSGDWVGGATPTNTSVQVDEETLSGAWVEALKARYGAAASGGVQWYAPGNEPGLWSDTHHDLVGNHHLTAQERWDRQSSVAAVVKAHDPTAKVMGPAAWGWLEYLCSDADTASTWCSEASPDRATHGGMDQTSWWLEQAMAWEVAHGKRLVDALDLHYYPQGDISPVVTRSLWDPTYKDNSWIDDTIRLIPRMREWVANHYPGTKLAICEYEFWHHDEPVGGVMQADALGIFARERLDMAMLWQGVTPDQPAYWAFRMYRNADGKGRAFGTTYASTSSADQGQVAAYSAKRPDGSLTVMLVNKTASARKVPITLQNYRNSHVRGFSYGAGTTAGLSGIATEPLGLSTGGTYSTVVPAMGFQLLDFSGKVEVPLLSSGLSAPTSASRGSPQTVTARISSVDGPSAVNPRVQLVLPSGSRVYSITKPTGWSCTKTLSGSYPVVTCTASSLTAKTYRLVKLRAYMPGVATSARSKLTVTASRVARPVPVLYRYTKVS
jgi:hypothetical protein